jgi:predicted dinucleotide-binding enzyme
VPVDKLGGKVVEGFNHLDAGILGQSSDVKGGRRVVFLASDDEAAATKVGALVEELGFASINLGRRLQRPPAGAGTREKWGLLIFKDLVKFD